MKLGLGTRFPDEYAAWEGRRKNIVQQFQDILAEQQAARHTKLEQDLTIIRVKLWEAVTTEVLKPFS